MSNQTIESRTDGRDSSMFARGHGSDFPAGAVAGSLRQLRACSKKNREDLMKGESSDREIPIYSFDTYVGSWSPDGRRFAFVRSDGQSADLCLITFGGGAAIRPLTQGANVTGIPSWSPDGATLYFSANFDVYVIDADGTNLKRIAGNRPRKGSLLKRTARSGTGSHGAVWVSSPLPERPSSLTENKASLRRRRIRAAAATD